jgi:aspartyl/asparaginyl beta-hydroxylase (cupin superfamily)
MHSTHGAPATTDRIAALAREARQAAAAGHVAQAMRAWQQLLALSPGQVQALAQLAQCHLQVGEPDRARELLGQALAIQPGFALAHAGMARVHLAAGDRDAALAALDEALAHEPAAWGARLEKAQLLADAGRHREAALNWSTALQYLPADAAQSPQLQPVLARAREAVAANQVELRDHLEALTGDLRRRERRRDVERFEMCLDIVTGRRAYTTAKPLMLPMPQLPAIEFFHREDFAWAAAVESATDAIEAELAAATTGDADGFVPYVQTAPGESSGQFAALDRNMDWNAYFLWRHGSRIEDHCARCPATVAAVEEAPLVHIRSRAPAVLFSVLRPGAHIPPHNGPTNTRLTVHLPLVVPEGCAFRVGDDTRPWKRGELFIFDDTIRHEAWNRGSARRVVLIFDIWHPMLSALERELVTRTVEGLVDYYANAADLGEL